MSARIEDWFAGGERVQAGAHRLFVRTEGEEGAPWVTLVHGFPTSSFDWARVAPRLTDAGRRLLLFDLLGFGDSDKPADHDYSIHEQADLTEALWRHHGIERTALVVHDYGVSVGQELLARHAEGALTVEIERIAFLNGGLYPDLHRALTVQKLLMHPQAGPIVSKRIDERGIERGLRRVFAPEHRPSRAELREHRLGIERRGGHRLLHRLIHYVGDRRRHAARWAAGLERTRVPRTFVWGMLDPISGAQVAERLAERMPPGELHTLADVGHYPQLEAPLRTGLLLSRFVGDGR